MSVAAISYLVVMSKQVRLTLPSLGMMMLQFRRRLAGRCSGFGYCGFDNLFNDKTIWRDSKVQVSLAVW